jgi:hypothetical protein
MACSVVVTHLDQTQTTYANYMAGISANDGTGWKLCMIPDLSVNGGPTQPMIVSLATGDMYQTTGTLPSQSLYPAYANLMSSGVLPTAQQKQVTFTPPVAPVTDAAFSVSSLVVTHADSSQDTYSNCMAGISRHNGKNWELSVIPNKFRSKAGDSYLKPFTIQMRDGDTYQVTGTLPPSWALAAASFGSPATMQFTTLPPGTVNTLKAVVQKA